MTDKIKPRPDGYHAVTAYLVVKGAAKAIDFYENVFGARVRMRMDGPDGLVGHAELVIGDSVVMLADESPMSLCQSPESLGGSTVGLSVYVDDVDISFRQALAAGARELRSVQNQFYGDRTGSFEDPFGHRWSVATQVEQVSEEEMKRRLAAMG